MAWHTNIPSFRPRAKTRSRDLAHSPLSMASNSSGSTQGPHGDYEFTFESIIDASSLVVEHLAVDPTADDRDSETLESSVEDYPEEFGRTYHAYKEGSYAFPNDVSEQDRLEFQNGIIMSKLFDGCLHLAPFSESQPPRRVLDVATGTGDWAIQMGDLYPTAYVEGIDLSPIQPQTLPPNVRFFVQDASEPWSCMEKFDYIHTRITLGSFSDFKTEIVQQAFDNLEPGGWLESIDLMTMWYSDDDSLDPHGPLARWARNLNIASESVNRPLSVAHKMKEWYEEVGFVDVEERVYKIPTNGWPADPYWKDIGKLWRWNLTEGLSGFTLGLFSRVLGWTEEEIQMSLVEVRRDIQDTRIHSYEPLYVVWGRKPLPDEL
ncbi:hypothetical protein FZEAL_5343 [Fusarium zealandicum]|uniref:Methyltransferase n=1 Tax=Fusarium zealandicum TaxID=1053134 RepID=A0A8H4UKY1_9HYPO|nr:hypothetical protein FZEAL_5343 [Fusarium zealandicum]